MRIVATLAAAALLAGCGAGPANRTGVVATTTIWGSIAEQVTECAGAESVRTLMPVGADAHDFAPSSADISAMVEAHVVFANGLGLESGMTSAMASAEADGAAIAELGPLLDPVPFPGGTDDPHVWLDMERAARGAQLIGQELAQAAGDDRFGECGQQVSQDIISAEQQLIATLAAVPQPDRVLVTDHDSLEYLARAYGFTVAGVVIPGGSTGAAPSSAELAALTHTIEQTGVPAIFSDRGESATLVDAVATEAGDVPVVPLYVESVGAPGSGAETYQTMMMANATAIANALS